MWLATCSREFTWLVNSGAPESPRLAFCQAKCRLKCVNKTRSQGEVCLLHFSCSLHYLGPVWIGHSKHNSYRHCGCYRQKNTSRVNALYMRHNCIQSTEKKQQLLMFDFSAQIYQYVPCILFSDEKYIGVQSHTPYCGCYETWYILWDTYLKNIYHF